jgi:sulfatase maturation enzyme AslB (radical SAM superfamily)
MFKFCSEPYDTVNIYNNGNVYSCLCGGWNTIGSIGNLLSESFADIFQSRQILKFRNSINDQSFNFCNPDRCGTFWSLPSFESLPNLTATLPTNIMLSIDSNCNLQCRSCRNNLVYNKAIDHNADIIMQSIIEAYANFDQKVLIYCDGSGDIFVSEAYKKFFQNSKLPSCFKFILTTNGNLLLKNKDIVEKLRDQIDLITVSLDAATNETYKVIRGGNFQTVLDGIKFAVELGINVSTQFVVQKSNYKELLDYRELGRALGIQNSGYQLITRWPHMSNQWWDQNKITADIDLSNDLQKLVHDSHVTLCGGLQSLLPLDTRITIT